MRHGRESIRRLRPLLPALAVADHGYGSIIRRFLSHKSI
ncbi:hypothetical protein APV28_1035 [Comamonas testosteroni]|nr:hypothetical protein APV28_1035 [Comamonas testosteroni]